MKHTVETYQRDMEAELDRILSMMEQHWGFRPTLTTHFSLGLVVRCQFDSYWKRAKKARFFIQPERISASRKPRNIVRNILHQYKGTHRFHYDRTKMPPVPVDPVIYKQLLQSELRQAGVRVQNLVVEPLVIAGVDFNIQGFAHKGQRVYITAANEGSYNKPELVARRFASEISDHRNTCKDCGIGVAPLVYRAYGWYEGCDKMGSRPAPDAVEETLHPRLSKKAKERMGIT